MPRHAAPAFRRATAGEEPSGEVERDLGGGVFGHGRCKVAAIGAQDEAVFAAFDSDIGRGRAQDRLRPALHGKTELGGKIRKFTQPLE